MTAVEFVILTPIMFLFLMLMVQFAIYLFAKQAAQAAVQAGGRVAREEAASKGCDHAGAIWHKDAEDAAVARAGALGGQLLTSLSATSVNGPLIPGPACVLGSVTVNLQATVPAVFPFMTMTVNVTSTGPVEQFVPHP
jgi:Flp pilus assembly protein TadG